MPRPWVIGETDAQVAVVPHLVTPDRDVLEAAFTRDGVVEPLAERLLNMPSDEWAVTSALLTIARQLLAYRPVGAELVLDGCGGRRRALPAAGLKVAG